MIRVLFVCHGSILKNPGKACKINDSQQREALTTPFWKNFEMTYKIITTLTDIAFRHRRER